MNPTTSFHLLTAQTLMARIYAHYFRAQSSGGARILLIIILVVLAHVFVKIIGSISEWLVTVAQRRRSRNWLVAEQPKLVTLLRLIANTFTWCIYFVALGLFLEECGINLTAYLASASVIGLAISFGSQGLVQDMVIGLTLIFSDAMDVDDMVEIAGAVVVVGRVQEVGLRFTKVVNLYNQVVFIPNRTVANVSRYPHGGLYAYADVQIPAGADRDKTAEIVRMVANGTWQQFQAIVLSAPIIDPVQTARDGGWEFLRVRLMIWPGQGSLIETTFRQQILNAMKTLDPNYAEWQVPVTYRALKADPQPAPPPTHGG